MSFQCTFRRSATAQPLMEHNMNQQKSKVHSLVLSRHNPQKVQQPTKSFIGFHGTLILESDAYKISNWCDKILDEVVKSPETDVPIAFDMEWPFNFAAGPGRVSLIQICKDLKVCFLFQVGRLVKLPEGLLRLLENEKIIFHGVMIQNDFRKLARDFNEPRVLPQVQRSLELGQLCNSVIGTSRRWSLANLAKEICHLNMNKEKKVRMGAWQNFNLTKEQKMYAAVDVYAGQLIYKQLKRLQKQKEIRENALLTSDIS